MGMILMVVCIECSMKVSVKPLSMPRLDAVWSCSDMPYASNKAHIVEIARCKLECIIRVEVVQCSKSSEDFKALIACAADASQTGYPNKLSSSINTH
jgi:hypothetical protein